MIRMGQGHRITNQTAESRGRRGKTTQQLRFRAAWLGSAAQPYHARSMVDGSQGSWAWYRRHDDRSFRC
jgi:hypothetical protein